MKCRYLVLVPFETVAGGTDKMSGPPFLVLFEPVEDPIGSSRRGRGKGTPLF
jgi:hypothetical protein